MNKQTYRQIYAKSSKNKENMSIYCKEDRYNQYESDILQKQLDKLKKYEEMFDLSIDIQCIVGYDSYFKLINNTFKNILGYSNKEIQEQSIFKYIYKDDISKCKRIIKLLIHGEKTELFRNRFISKDGTIKWLEWSAVARADESNIHFIGRDVTAQKEMEDELLEIKERNEIILQSITDAFFALDHELRIIYINEQAETIFAKRPEEILYKKIDNIAPICFDNEIYLKFQKVLKKRLSVHFEYYSVHSQNWFEFSIYPSREGLSVYFMDITQRKKTEQTLQQSVELFTKLFTYNPNIMFIVSEEGEVVAVNKKWISVIGTTYEEAKGKSVLEVFKTVELKEDIFTIEAFFNIEIEFLTSNNSKRSGILSKEKIIMNNNQCFLYTIVDITEMKVINEKVAKMERLNLVAQMAAGVAHEIRNPMTTVHGLLQIFKKKEDFQEHKKHIDLMLSELNRTNFIISEFLNLARNKPTGLKTQNLNDIIKNILPLIEADAIQYNIGLVTKLNKLPNQLLNENEMRQLILNFSKNAIEAMVQHGTLSIETYVTDENIVMSFTDQGPGIPDEIQNKIGTPFFTTKEKGTGLGIAICTGIANRHNASIIAETDCTGTTFYVYFKKRCVNI